MQIKFKQANTPEDLEGEIILSTCDDCLVIRTTQTLKDRTDNHETIYGMDREQLSEYIGALLHFQSKLKRGI
tara:strand:+ start:17 stop:232 length:216 start_codon:yes stop_codon:yes gene_type:complete